MLIIYVTKQPMTTETPTLNDHNKAEYPPMHTAEHILNQTMVRRYGCPRSRNAHIERKKSKVSYELPTCPSDAEVQEIVDKVNDTYLKINNQEDGTRSYGRVVDLLLAEYKQTHGISK